MNEGKMHSKVNLYYFPPFFHSYSKIDITPRWAIKAGLMGAPMMPAGKVKKKEGDRGRGDTLQALLQFQSFKIKFCLVQKRLVRDFKALKL